MTKTPEEWARAKGLPFAPALILPATPRERPQEREVCALLAGAAAHNSWSAEQQLLEEDFDAGVAAFRKEPLR